MKPPPAREADAGFTLIEVVVALALFALIALAGVALIDAVLGVQRRTDGRLERIGDLGRAVFVIGRDFDAIADAPLLGTPLGVGFDRRGADGRRIAIRYAVDGAEFVRFQDGRRQIAVDHVAGVRWRYLGGPGWQDRWPATPEQGAVWPKAVAVELTVSGGPSGTVRRVVDLPVRPLAPGTVAR